MKKRIGSVIWICFVIGLVYFSIRMTMAITIPKTVNIGPHEIAEITANDTFITPKAIITLRSKDFFTLKDMETKMVVYSELVQPQGGETSPHFFYNGHSHWPTILHSLYVFAYRFPIFWKNLPGIS